MRLPQITFGKVLAGTAVVLVATTGTAYAANTVGSGDIINNSIKSEDIRDGAVGSIDLVDGNVKSVDLKNGDVRSVDILNETVASVDLLNGSITADDLASDSVGFAEIQTDAVQATEIADNSIDSGEIVDFGLSNRDVGVLFAQVNADGSIFSSSGGVTGTKIGTGTYEVDFGVNISSCAFVSTQGEGGVGGAGGAITGVTDRSGNAEAVFATTRTDANVLADRAFQLVVVC